MIDLEKLRAGIQARILGLQVTVERQIEGEHEEIAVTVSDGLFFARMQERSSFWLYVLDLGLYANAAELLIAQYAKDRYLLP